MSIRTDAQAAVVEARTARIHVWLQGGPDITPVDRIWILTWGSDELRSLALAREQITS